MKALILTSIICSLLFVLGGCFTQPAIVRATGSAYEVVVTANQSLWINEAGMKIKEELTSEIPGLPQYETSMRVTYVKPDDFNGIMKLVRNILTVTVDNSIYSQVSMKMERNRWAQGQVVVNITAPNEASIIEYLDENKRILVDFYTKVEMRRMAEILKSDYSKAIMDKVMSKFDIMLNAPTDIKSFGVTQDTTNFFWASNNARLGRTDIVVYSFPYKDITTFSWGYLLSMRDSILGANIPGSFPNSYLSTNIEMTSYKSMSLYGKYCGVLRGLWEMQGDMMGGPFVSFARLDEANNRVVVAEGFVYSPETDKKNYMRRLEAALHTFRFSGEEDMPLDGLAL
jgi:hypothetical protein